MKQSKSYVSITAALKKTGSNQQ